MSHAVNLRISLFTTTKSNLNKSSLHHPIHQIENHLGQLLFFSYQMLTLLVPQQQHHEWISLFTNVKKIVQIPLLNSAAELKNYIFHHREKHQ